jgi:hypothetical protein
MAISNDPIELALGLRPIEEVREDTDETLSASDTAGVLAVTGNTIPTVTTTNADEDETVRDIELARSNIKNIIEHGDDSLKEMINLAKQSESPRAYEVAATLMKTLLDANKDFVEMSTKKKYAKEEILHPKDEAATTNVTNNNLILSTTDLLKMIKGEG